jgi:hypothetical protein
MGLWYKACCGEVEDLDSKNVLKGYENALSNGINEVVVHS